MFAPNHRWRIGLLLLALMVILAACGGGGGSSSTKPKGPDPDPTSLEGRVSGPTAILSAEGNSKDVAPQQLAGSLIRERFGVARALAAAASIEGETPLANVQVLVYELEDYLARGGDAAIVQQAQTDDAGMYTMKDIPAGKDLYVFVPGLDVRFGAIVPAPAKGKKTDADVNSVTTLAAELWGALLSEHDASTLPGDMKSRLDESVEEASFALNALGHGRLRDALKALLPYGFGEGLPAASSVDVEFAPLLEALNATSPKVLRLAGWSSWIVISACRLLWSPSGAFPMIGWTKKRLHDLKWPV